MFKNKPTTTKTPIYYYTKVLAAGKIIPEEMQLYQANGNTNMNDI
jgi:hypothetical protein